MSTVTPTPHIVPEHDVSPYGKTRLQSSDKISTEPDTQVSLRNIHKTYLLGLEGVPALRGVNVNIKRGEFICIYGTSGGGKTTLLNLIGTIDRPTKGELVLCGTPITNRTPDKTLAHLRLARMGFVFQSFNLLSSLTALENVELPMILANVPHAKRHARATELLRSVGMGKRLSHFPSQLSGGEQQRVTIARALANNPEILLLDEPTGDLDTVNTAIVMQMLYSLNKEKKITMIMVTHDVMLKQFADRVIWMRDGLVQHVEAVSDADRHECMAKLEEKLLGSPAIQNTQTEIRDPSFYAPHAYMLRQMRTQVLGTEEQALRLIAEQRLAAVRKTHLSEADGSYEYSASVSLSTASDFE